MARAQANPTSHEVLSITLLALGTLLFLALVSYTPADVPGWFPLSSVASHKGPVYNFIGRLGAIVACCSYAFLGAASYLLAATLLGYGGAKLLNPALRLGPRAPWALVFLASGACLAHLLPLRIMEIGRLNLAGPGGWLGKWVGEYLFRAVLNTVGSVIVLGVLYVVSLILMTGIHPLHAFAELAALPATLRARRDAREEAEKEERRRWELDAARQEKERRKLDRTSGRKTPAAGASLAEGENDEVLVIPAPPRAARDAKEPAEPKPTKEAPPGELFALEPEQARPAPQIIDSAVLPPPRKREPKKDKFAPLTSISCENYELPSLSLLDPIDTSDRHAADPGELIAIQNNIIDTLKEFGVVVSRGDITRGPTITRYEVYPANGVRVDKIVSLERDIARSTRAERINILAPIPGKDTVGIEIANLKKQKVTLRELLESDDFQHTKAKIPIALGKDVYGKTIIADLAAMPHGLVAGTTGSGKSVCINAIIASILYRFTPEDLRFIMIDPKVVEMQIYNTLPHLVVPVVTDPKKVLLALRWAIDEMEKRYEIFAKTGVRNIGSFNARPKLKTQAELDAEADALAEKEEAAGELARAAEPAPVEPPTPEAITPPVAEGEPAEPAPIDFDNMRDDELFKVAPQRSAPVAVPRDSETIIPERMPYIVIIVDELADLMQTAPADVESAIARITQKARAAGIHMIIATQTPRADVITGVIKANVPCRIAFQVASALDSRVILDENGAERLLGQGDTLYRPPGTSQLVRAQGVLVTDEEIKLVVEHASRQSQPNFEPSIHDRLKGSGVEEEVSAEDEELVEQCIEVMRQEKKASTSLFQRRLRLGYTRAARILDILEARGYVGAGEGAKPREILVDLDAFAP